MQNFLILLAIVAICTAGFLSYRKRLRSGCCGAGGDGPEKKVRVKDRNKANYPYVMRLCIDGMTCANCARRVENALNRIDGVWAAVDLSERSALVRCKAPVSEEALLRTVKDAGYTVLSCEKING